LPIIRDVLMRGIVNWSMAELLARHATPMNEEALVTEARTSTVRAMRERLQPGKTDELPAERSTITMTVKRTEAWSSRRRAWRSRSSPTRRPATSSPRRSSPRA
jgi:hypothetical protein